MYFLSKLWWIISLRFEHILVYTPVYLRQKLSERTLILLLTDTIQLLFRLVCQILRVVIQPGNLGLTSWFLLLVFIPKPVIEDSIHIYFIIIIISVTSVLCCLRAVDSTLFHKCVLARQDDLRIHIIYVNIRICPILVRFLVLWNRLQVRQLFAEFASPVSVCLSKLLHETFPHHFSISNVRAFPTHTIQIGALLLGRVTI